MTHLIKKPVVNEKLAYFCGFILGDGSIYIRKEKHDYCIKAVGNPKDEKAYYDRILQPLIKELFDITIKMKAYDKNTTYGFQISSKQLVEFLTEEIGLPTAPKYENLHLPKAFYQDEKLIRACIRGIFDTDGCICFKKRSATSDAYPVISITSKSSALISQINAILEGLQLKGVQLINYELRDTRLKRGFNNISRIEINGRKNLKRWTNSIGTWHPKHRRKIEKHSGG